MSLTTDQSGSRGVDALDALLDRLIPADDAPGARDLLVGSDLRERVPGLGLFLEELGDFPLLQPHEQDRRLHHLEDSNDRVFAALVETVHELYYADHRSWQSVGYTTHLPGRP